MKYWSGAGCRHCGSSDIWQPHVHTWRDGILAWFGYGRFECRKCRRRVIFRIRRKFRLKIRLSNRKETSN